MDIDNSNNNIIEFLIECLVLSKLTNNKNTTKETTRINTGIRSTLNLNRKMLDIQLDRLINIDNMKNDYENFDLIYSFNEN